MSGGVTGTEVILFYPPTLPSMSCPLLPRKTFSPQGVLGVHKVKLMVQPGFANLLLAFEPSSVPVDKIDNLIGLY